MLARMIRVIPVLLYPLFLAFSPLTAWAQGSYDIYICPGSTSSEFTPDDQAPGSDGICGDGTELTVTHTGSTDIVSSIQVQRLGSPPDGPHKGKLLLNWVAGREGTIIVQVYYNRSRKNCNLCTGCSREGKKLLYTYTIRRVPVAPGGILTGNTVATVTDPATTVPFSLTFNQSGKRATRVRYWNGSTTVEESISLFESSKAITFYATGYGNHILNTELRDECGDWYPGPSKTVTIHPTCYLDDPAAISLSVVGSRVETTSDGDYMVQKDVPYTIQVSGIADFSSHYEWQVADGGEDIVFSGNTFTVLKGLGSYRIEAIKRPGREACATLPPIKVFVGGRDIVIEQICPITLPADLPELGYSISEGDPVLQHFAATIKSKRSIIVMPGVSLALGAELVLIKTDPASAPAADPQLNFVQQTSYDEYGRVLGESRNYFDEQGNALQSQYKNLTAGVVLAQTTLYDANNRPVITTLPAPVSSISTVADECTETQPVADQLQFAYKEDFVKAQGGEAYNYTHFDLDKENSPVPLEATEAGTLGWYYSTNNGTSTHANLNEPLVGSTQYPYSRILLQPDGSGEAKGVTGPGDAFRAGNGHVATINREPVSATDTYLNNYFEMRGAGLNLPAPASLEGQFFKTISYDWNQRQSVVYTDKEGRAMISLYLGTASTPITTSYNFYDVMGRLMASISPNGIKDYNGSNFAQIDKTLYFYNHKGWVVTIEETDAGRTEYVYRKDGQIRFSQNSEQRKAQPQRYSYTHYDQSGRPSESGEYIAGSGSIAFRSTAMNAILETTDADGGLSGTKQDRSFITYDMPDANIPGGRIPRFTHGAVASTRKDGRITTWYSYDELGRVEWMVQQIAGLGVKTFDYRYSPTGQVQEVAYQKGVAAEQFTRYYEYDANGRVYKAYISRQPLQYDVQGRLTNQAALQLQATYQYYLHGPLKRVELGNGLQGIDYVYTADGKLKSINHADPTKDPGGDGINNQRRADVFGMTLDYYAQDYTSHSMPSEALSLSGYADQYGGQIKAQRWHSPIEADKSWGYAYTYDPRYQLQKADWGQATGNALAINPAKPYYENIGGYDPNGNIASLQRKDNLGSSMADFTYQYIPHTNRLTKITQGTTSTPLINYTYNDLGQLTGEQEGDQHKYLTYDVAGQVTGVYKDEAHQIPIATFTYDDRGFRLCKTTYSETGAPTLKTWYVRDAAGQVTGTYEENTNDVQGAQLAELPVYGAGRIGIFKPQYGLTFFELTDHLGNVRAVIGDQVEVTYLATMETERAANEDEYFENISRTPTAGYINHTPEQITVDDQTETIAQPNEVLRINNGMDNPKKPVGAAKMLMVHPGDVIKAEVFVKYADFNQSNNNGITSLAGYLASAFGAVSFTENGTNIFGYLDQTPTSVFSALNEVDESLPRAFLSYVLYDRNFNPVEFDQVQVSTAAEIPASGDPLAHPHERLWVELKVQKEGFIYLYVSNQSDQHMDVYFDDFKVVHQYSDIVAGADYYPNGMVIEDRQITREDYRYGYQGQFSEKDKETGLNTFALRMYDSRIARATSIDTYAQFNSPYIGMHGNNPTDNVDPDGGLVVNAIGAVVGGVIGGGLAAWEIYEKVQKGEASWDAAAAGRILLATGTGALAGSGVGGIVVGTLSGVVGEAGDQWLEKGEIDGGKVAVAAVAGYLGGKGAEALTHWRYGGKIIKGMTNGMVVDLKMQYGKALPIIGKYSHGVINNFKNRVSWETFNAYIGAKAGSIAKDVYDAVQTHNERMKYQPVGNGFDSYNYFFPNGYIDPPGQQGYFSLPGSPLYPIPFGY